ncbi:NADH-quinone oxidoreductase subunit J [Tessaracoccus rhinocerotis]|uniref:NADH-quinone oxidoreductase subunit J n=1 Tax=Tessaracoccus rhinocerotis TaxID=1689449 RepID=A0A553K5L0_9ACTN|nr:NADH-quinone oxidoreductase subunit J [Tessaracoccus rhinocerotis]TRY19971.1 NADH-quinone oxidoreductase subunit J [Tessaracoccus rhinocerotis]
MTSFIPLVSAGEVAFWVCGPIAILLAVGMVLMRKPVHSAICIAGVMLALAVMYAAQDAPFLFVIQIIVYTGAILMLFLFVVMLVGVDTSDSVVETLKGHRVASFLAVIGLAVLLVMAVGQVFEGEPAGLAAANEEFGGNLEGLAALLFSRYVFAFEATAALLITAAVGAMVLAHGERLKAKKSQVVQAQERMEAYAAEGKHPGVLPNSGVYARFNAIHAPALLPDGSVAEASVSETLTARGAIVAVDQLRTPADRAFKAIERVHSDAEGESE